MTVRILISDKMSEEGLGYFRGQEGFEVDYQPEILMDDLAGAIGRYDALVIRSRTQVTRETLANTGALKIIGRAGAGVDNVDLDAATERGILVMNTPGANTMATAEHAISMLMALARRIPFADSTMKEGRWAKKDIVGVELFDKTLGIIGLGRIGRVVAERLNAFGMKILAHDPFLTCEVARQLNVEPADLDTICAQADMITIHCPINDETRGLLDARRLGLMKPTALVVNCARGGIVDEDALYDALKEGRIAGAAVDVFATEPLPGESKLRELPNAVLTPHLAATTGEAQEKVARELAEQLRDSLVSGVVRNAVNAPSIDNKTYQQLAPVLDLCLRLGRLCSQYIGPGVNRIEITYKGAKAKHDPTPLTTELIKGFLQFHFSEPVNSVNALYIARRMGIKIVETRTEEIDDVYAGLITVRTVSDTGEVNTISGTLNHRREPRLVMVNQKQVDAIPQGEMLLLENRDVPGIIGSVGTCLGRHGINIAMLSWGRLKPGGDAMTVINTDNPISDEVLAELGSLPNVLGARHVVI